MRRPIWSPGSTAHAPVTEQDAETLVIDVRGVTFIDSCGIGELSAHQRTHREGRRLVVIRDRHTPLDRVLNVTGMDKWLETTEDPTAFRSCPRTNPLRWASDPSRAPPPLAGQSRDRCRSTSSLSRASDRSRSESSS
jgi:hypothetical protein